MDRILGYFFFGPIDELKERDKKAESDFISYVVQLDNLLSDNLYTMIQTDGISVWENFDKKDFLEKMYHLTLNLASNTTKTHQYQSMSKKLLPLVMIGIMYLDFDVAFINNIMFTAYGDIHSTNEYHRPTNEYLLADTWRSYCESRIFSFDTYIAILKQVRNAVKIAHDMFFKSFDSSNLEYEHKVCNVVPEIQNIVISSNTGN